MTGDDRDDPYEIICKDIDDKDSEDEDEDYSSNWYGLLIFFLFFFEIP